MRPTGTINLHLAPVPLAVANSFISLHHRHNRPVDLGSIFCMSVVDDDGLIRGVAIIGRPVARMNADGWTAEVLRTCTDGTPNANSILYGAAWRAAKALGYRRLITYTQHSESGASLAAAGFIRTASLSARKGWDTPLRSRNNDVYPVADRWRWEIATEARPEFLPKLPEAGVSAQGVLL